MAKHSANNIDSAAEGTSQNSTYDSPIGLTQAFSPVELETADVFLEDATANYPDGDEDVDEAGENAGEFSDGAAEQATYEDEPPTPEEAELSAATQQWAFDKKAAKKREKEIYKAAKKAGKVEMSKKSRRVRRALIAVIILLILMIIAAGVGIFYYFNNVQNIAVQQTVEQQDVSNLSTAESNDSTSEATKQTEVVALTGLLGKTQDEAVAELKHGATVTRTSEVNEEGNDIKTSLTVALTDEPADSKSGTPSVYLGLNEEGKVIQAGYSASVTALGYGSISFTDAVNNEHIVEKTLQEAGVGVAEGTVSLPANKEEYSTYASDGKTLTKESYTFTGTASVNGADHEWSSVLMYDYATANANGNLADTLRMIYVYVEA